MRTPGKEVTKAVVGCAAGLEIVQILTSHQQTTNKEILVTLHSLLRSTMVSAKRMKPRGLKSQEALRIRCLLVD